MGTQSVNGFISLFKNLCDEKTDYNTSLIKAGPGCGKSTFMKKVGLKIANKGLSTEFIHCSADPNSLDGVICREKNFAIIDATAPHDEKPSYPGARENIVTFYDFMDNDYLKQNKQEIISYFNECAKYHERVARFVSATRLISDDMIKSSIRYIDNQKLYDFVEKIVSKHLPFQQDKKPSEEMRYISAVTPNGLVDYSKVNSEYYQTRYVFSDRYGGVSSAILASLRKKALQNGYDIITCRSAVMSENIVSALFIPSAGICFVVNNLFTKHDFTDAKVINEKRFMKFCDGSVVSQQSVFCKKAILDLVDQASLLSTKALASHDEIEKFYSKSMDFKALTELQERYFKKIVDVL